MSFRKLVTGDPALCMKYFAQADSMIAEMAVSGAAKKVYGDNVMTIIAKNYGPGARSAIFLPKNFDLIVVFQDRQNPTGFGNTDPAVYTFLGVNFGKKKCTKLFSTTPEALATTSGSNYNRLSPLGDGAPMFSPGGFTLDARTIELQGEITGGTLPLGFWNYPDISVFRHYGERNNIILHGEWDRDPDLPGAKFLYTRVEHTIDPPGFYSAYADSICTDDVEVSSPPTVTITFDFGWGVVTGTGIGSTPILRNIGDPDVYYLTGEAIFNAREQAAESYIVPDGDPKHLFAVSVSVSGDGGVHILNEAKPSTYFGEHNHWRTRQQFYQIPDRSGTATLGGVAGGPIIEWPGQPNFIRYQDAPSSQPPVVVDAYNEYYARTNEMGFQCDIGKIQFWEMVTSGDRRGEFTLVAGGFETPTNSFLNITDYARTTDANRGPTQLVSIHNLMRERNPYSTFNPPLVFRSNLAYATRSRYYTWLAEMFYWLPDYHPMQLVQVAKTGGSLEPALIWQNYVAGWFFEFVGFIHDPSDQWCGFVEWIIGSGGEDTVDYVGGIRLHIAPEADGMSNITHTFTFADLYTPLGKVSPYVSPIARDVALGMVPDSCVAYARNGFVYFGIGGAGASGLFKVSIATGELSVVFGGPEWHVWDVATNQDGSVAFLLVESTTGELSYVQVIVDFGTLTYVRMPEVSGAAYYSGIMRPLFDRRYATR